MPMTPAQTTRLNGLISSLYLELDSAIGKHAPMNSAHEAYGVILEELDEFWQEVRKRREERSAANMRTELLHTAAMALRALIDLGL